MVRELVTHSPEALTFYRQQMQLSVDLLAKKSGISLNTLKKADIQNQVFSLKQLNKLAEILTVSVLQLTIDVQVTRVIPKTIDFRNKENKSLNDAEIEEEQYQLNKVIHQAYIDRENLLNINESMDDMPDAFSLSLSGNNAKADAQIIRDFLEVDKHKITEASSDYYRSWRLLLENKDILVFEKSRTSIGSEGMALYYDSLPIILIFTSGQSNARRLFTLIHELVHLGLKQSAVDGQILTSKQAEERYCNLVAGYVLVPESDIKKYFDTSNSVDLNVAKIRKNIKVSRPVIAIQLKQVGKITQTELDDYLNELENKVISGIPRSDKKYRAYNRFGKIYLQQVFSAVWADELTFNAASQILRVANNSDDLGYLEKKAFS